MDKKKSKEIEKVADIIIGDRVEHREDIMANLNNDNNKKKLITVTEMMEVRERVQCSNSAIEKVAKYITILLKKKEVIKEDERIFEGQLRKKLGQLESFSAIPPKLITIKCQTTKDNTSMCNYYYLENVVLLLERLNAGCCLEGKFIDSIKVSSLENMSIIKFGCDRGMSDLIMQVSLANNK